MPLSNDYQADISDLIVDFPKVRRRKLGKAKSVSFADNSSLRLYHEDDGRRHASWYNKVDYNTFRQNTRAEISSARQMDGEKNGTDDEEFCTVGVEIYLSQELLSEVMERREIHKIALLREQGRLQDGCERQDVLAGLSKEYSKWACSRALFNARNVNISLSRTTSRSKSSRAA